MDIKKRPNHKRYIQILRNMTPEERLMQAFELTEFARELFREGLRIRFPDMPEDELQKLYLESLSDKPTCLSHTR